MQLFFKIQLFINPQYKYCGIFNIETNNFLKEVANDFINF